MECNGRYFTTEPLQDNFNIFYTLFDTHPCFEYYRQIISTSGRIIINGEGSIYGRQGKGLVLFILAAWSARSRGKTVDVCNLSIDLEDSVMESWYLSCQDEIRGIWLRDRISFERLEKFSSKKIFLSADAAFSYVNHKIDYDCIKDWSGLYPDELLWKDICSPCVVITGSSRLFRLDRAKCDPWEGISYLISKLRENGFTSCLYAADLGDSPLFRKAAIEHQCCFISATTPTNVILSVMKQCCAMVSGRWHASILASTVGLPSVMGNANFFKTSYLNELFYGKKVSLFDYASLTPAICESIVERIKYLTSDKTHSEQLLEIASNQSRLFEESVANMLFP